MSELLDHEAYIRARMVEPDWMGGIEPLQREIIRLRELLAAPPVATDGCTWQADDEGTYQTTCGNAFQFIDSGPDENFMKFCCYCGLRLIVPAPPADAPQEKV